MWRGAREEGEAPSAALAFGAAGRPEVRLPGLGGGRGALKAPHQRRAESLRHRDSVERSVTAPPAAVSSAGRRLCSYRTLLLSPFG